MYNFEAIFVMKGQHRFVTIVSMVTAPERSLGEKKRKRVTLINRKVRYSGQNLQDHFSLL